MKSDYLTVCTIKLPFNFVQNTLVLNFTEFQAQVVPWASPGREEVRRESRKDRLKIK